MAKSAKIEWMGVQFRKPVKVRAFNIRKVPEPLFFRIKMAAAAESMSSRDWVLQLAEKRIKELEQEGKLPKQKPD